MSPKARRLKGRIPLGAHLRGAVRRWSTSFWADIRGKTKAKKPRLKNPWPLCPTCDHRRPEWEFGKCEEHPESCGCCLYNPRLHPRGGGGGGGSRRMPRINQFRPGDPARQGHKTEKQEREERQAGYQAEIEKQGREEAEAREQGTEGNSETAGQDGQGGDAGSGDSGGDADSGGGGEE